MRETHKNVFFNTAQHFTCWIGLREPNALADNWIGQPFYTPKAKECKAKTADNAAHPFGGLVVDPTICPAAFKPETLGSAIQTWRNKFVVGGHLPINFTVINSGTEAGLVKHNGSFIHAD